MLEINSANPTSTCSRRCLGGSTSRLTPVHSSLHSFAHGSLPTRSGDRVGALEFLVWPWLLPRCSFGLVAAKWCTYRRRVSAIYGKHSAATVCSLWRGSPWFTSLSSFSGAYGE